MAYAISELKETGNMATRTVLISVTRRDDAIDWLREFARGAGYTDLFHYDVDEENDALDFMIAKGSHLRQFMVEPE